MPGEFVPAAEKTGLIEPLTRYVLDEALGQLARWSSEGRDYNVAVNLSMRNLHDTTLPEQVARLLRKWQLAGERLTVELTESAIVSDPVRTGDVIRGLKELGVGIAIDDFGTGYTSLAYLARLAVTQLKIDRSFVQNMHDRADDAAIVRSIITLGHDLGLQVVAEGVESKAHLRAARRPRLRHRAGLLAEPPAAARRARRMAVARPAHRRGRRVGAAGGLSAGRAGIRWHRPARCGPRVRRCHSRRLAAHPHHRPCRHRLRDRRPQGVVISEGRVTIA